MRQHTHWRWRLDEVYVRVQGEMRYLWRAVDHEGEVLESFVTKERDKAAALKFMKKLMKRHGCAKVVTTDGLRSYRAAMKELNIGERQAGLGFGLGAPNLRRVRVGLTAPSPPMATALLLSSAEAFRPATEFSSRF